MRRLGLALAGVPTGQRQVPLQRVPPVAEARLAWAMAQQSPGQGHVQRAHQLADAARIHRLAKLEASAGPKAQPAFTRVLLVLVTHSPL